MSKLKISSMERYYARDLYGVFSRPVASRDRSHKMACIRESHPCVHSCFHGSAMFLDEKLSLKLKIIVQLNDINEAAYG